MELLTEKTIKEKLHKEEKQSINVLFSYKISNLTQTQKVKFFYALKGRNKEGVLQRTKSAQLAKSVVLTPLEHEKEMQEFFARWNVLFNRKKIILLEES